MTKTYPYGPNTNVKLFKAVRKKILEEPRRLRMGVWLEGAISSPHHPENPPCGTVGCLAGWAIAIDYLSTHPSLKLLGDDGVYGSLYIGSRISEKAAALLGLPYDKACEIFYMRWPEYYFDAYEEAIGPKGRARATARFIDYIVGERDVNGKLLKKRTRKRSPKVKAKSSKG